MKTPASLLLRNPHLDGDAFFWQAGGTGVLLVHGFTATTAEVRLLAQVLYSHGYTVSAPLLPGHGTTPQDCNRHSWQDWYAAVEQSYLELARSCQKVVVGGESAGALLTLRLAAQHPEIAAVLCYAPALRLKLPRLQQWLLSSLVPFVEYVSKPASKDDNPWKGYAVQPLRAAQQFIRLQKDLPAWLPYIHQPMLILQGRLDPTVHPQSPQLIFDGIGSADKQLLWLEQSTHCVILDKEHALAAQMTLEFLQRVLNLSPMQVV